MARFLYSQVSDRPGATNIEKRNQKNKEQTLTTWQEINKHYKNDRKEHNI